MVGGYIWSTGTNSVNFFKVGRYSSNCFSRASLLDAVGMQRIGAYPMFLWSVAWGTYLTRGLD